MFYANCDRSVVLANLFYVFVHSSAPLCARGTHINDEGFDVNLIELHLPDCRDTFPYTRPTNNLYSYWVFFFSFLDLYIRQYSCCVNGFCLPLPMPQQSFHKCCLNILHDVCINGNYRDRVDHESRSFFMTTSSRVYWQLLSSSSCIFVCLWTRKYGWNCARPNWWTFGMWLKNLMAIKRVHLNSARISIAIWAKTNFSSVFLCRKLQRCSLALTNIPNGNRRRSERGEYQVELDQFFHLQPARPGDRVPTASYTISIIECVLEAFISRDALTWHHTHIRSKA